MEKITPSAHAPNLVSVAEAARAAGVTENLIRYHMRYKRLHRYVNGAGRVRVDKDEVVNLFNSFKVK